MKKKLIVIGSAVVGLLLLLVLAITVFVDPNQFRPRVEAEMTRALGRKVAIGSIRIAWLSAGIALENLAIGDDPAFSTKPFVTARSVTVGVDSMPLIMSRSLRVESFRLEEPQATLLRSASGTWNFSNLGAASSAGPAPAPSEGASGSAAAMSVLVQKVTIANGRIVVGSPSFNKQRIYEGVKLEVTDLSYTSRFPFSVALTAPGAGSVALQGEAGPVNLKDVATTPFQAKADVKHLDIASTGFVDSGAGLAGLIDFAGQVTSAGGRITSQGKLNASQVQLGPAGSPSKVPIEIDYETDYNPAVQNGVVKKADVHVGKAVAHLTGSYSLAGETPSVVMKLSGQAMPASELEAALPAVGFTLPSGASLRQGSLNTEMTISGPIDRLVIRGPISLSNARLSGFDLSGKMGALGSFAGLPKGSDTEIQLLRAGVRAAPEGIDVDGLTLLVPAIGTLTGHGTVAPKGALDFTMLAKVTALGGLANGLARTASLGHLENEVPFHVRGTTSNPTFVPDVKAITGNVVKGSAVGVLTGSTPAGRALDGLLGRKR